MAQALADRETVAPVAPRSVAVKAVGLTKVFKDFWLRNRVRAVDAIDLEIRHGEVFGLLGPNGSGKSTTIKMMLGLLHPTGGRIAVLGHHPKDVAIKRKLGYLPEESYLYRFLNGRETLDYYGKLFGLGRDQRKRRTGELLEMVGLDRVARRPVGEYSKGMQRRIGLAQALINDPQLLILDEPTTGLDPLGTAHIKELIVDLKARGKTVLLCSHLLADVEDVCDRAAIMFGGKVRARGTIDELLEQQDQTRIITGRLDAATEERLMALLEQQGLTDATIDHPRQKLEIVFRRIVEEAQREGVATSGAGATTGIASFLAAGPAEPTTPVEPEPQAVLDRLTTPKPADPPPEPAPRKKGEKVSDTFSAAEHGHAADDVLGELTGTKPKPADPPRKPARRSSPPPPTRTPPAEDEDRSVIDDLLK